MIKKRKLSKEAAYAMAWRRQKERAEVAEGLLEATKAELEETRAALVAALANQGNLK